MDRLNAEVQDFNSPDSRKQGGKDVQYIKKSLGYPEEDIRACESYMYALGTQLTKGFYRTVDDLDLIATDSLPFLLANPLKPLKPLNPSHSSPLLVSFTPARRAGNGRLPLRHPRGSLVRNNGNAEHPRKGRRGHRAAGRMEAGDIREYRGCKSRIDGSWRAAMQPWKLRARACLLDRLASGIIGD